MDLTVLDIGLRNHHISSVQCFFKIQIETFCLSQTQNGNQNLSGDERSDKNNKLYNDWKQVFVKLINVISVNINDKNSTDFAICLARTGLKACNQLLAIITEINSDFISNQTKDLFKKLFMNNIRLIRISFRITENKTEFKPIEDKNVKQFSANSTESEVISHYLHSNGLILGQFWIKSNRNLTINWNEIIKIVFKLSIEYLKNKDFEDLNHILTQLGIEFQEIIENIYRFTSDEKIRLLLNNKFNGIIGEFDKSIDENMSKIHKIVDNLKTESNISLPIDWLIQMTSESIQRTFFLSMFRHINDIDFSVLSKNIVWNYLIDRNDSRLLNFWIQKLSNTQTNSFPFDWTLTQEMIESVRERASMATKESVLNELSIRGVFSSNELNDFQSILYRFGRNDYNLWINTSNGFIDESLVLSNSSFKPKIFLEKLIEYCCEHNLNEFLYIYYEIITDSPILCVNSFTNLLKASISCVNNASNEQFLENILLTAQYVYSIPSPVTIKSLIEKANPYLGFIASTYSSITFNEICSQKTDSTNEMESSESLPIDFFRTQFPIIFSSFLESANNMPTSDLSYETPTIYLLLKDSIPFDVTKMFYWQSMNKLIEPNEDSLSSMVFNQLPHFSNTKLADLYGLKANLTFTYYLNQGRVVEAYNKFISNRKVLNSKSIELACRRAALVAYNDTSDHHIAVSSVIFQQLLSDDSTQTLLHLSVAHIVMSFAADFLSLNARQQQTELSSLLKRSHYYCDKRAAAKLLQLTVTAINRKYKNFMNIQIEECFDWKIAIRFATLHNLELPLDLLTKCAVSDNWLVFTICCQLHQYPKESVLSALKHFNNECISDHLHKAFQTSQIVLATSEMTDNSRILNRKESQKRTTKHLRNVLYSRIGLSRPEVVDNSNKLQKSSLRLSTSPSMESDDMSIASETDYNGVETISVVSSSNASDEEVPKLNAENSPKDLLQLILTFQTDSAYDPRKPLLYSSIPLSNPILCLIACSSEYGSEKFNILSSFSCWLLSSVDFEIRKQFCEKYPNFDPLNWNLENNYQMLDIITRDTESYVLFVRGLKLFNLNVTPLINLLNFLILFFNEKNYYNVQNLKLFQDNLWKYEEPLNCENVFLTKEWIQKSSVILLTNALRNAKNHELIVLLRHFEFARIQGSFSADIKVHDFRKLYRLCQCLAETDAVLPIDQLLSDELDVQNELNASNERYSAIIKSVISNLQLNGHFIEARNFATNADIESNDLIINEWTLKAANNLDSFEFWEKCWDGLSSVDNTLVSVSKVFNKFLSQIPSLIVKCFLIFKCLIASQALDNLRESSLFETMLWKCIVRIESSSLNTGKNSDIWSRIWSDIIGFIKSNKSHIKNKLLLESNDVILPFDEMNRTLDKVIENLLNNSCIEKAHDLSLLFHYNHQDLDIILVCNDMAEGLIKSLSEAPLSVQLKTKAIEQFQKKELSSDFSEEQKEIIRFIESISSLTTIGRKACQKILLHFKISCILHRSYSEMESDPELTDLDVLKCLIAVHSTITESLAFAKELIALNEISDENIASILCKEILFILKNSSEDYEASRESSFSNLVEMSPSFLSLVRLLNDTTILGTKLLNESEPLLNDSDNNHLLTKLYIKAHECFSLACDVKGIALVLRKARLFITKNLLQLRDFHSILRLMTGIGRYSEMTYCFDLFKENNEFELLLSKRIEKVPQLRIALLDYLNGDKEVFPLVTLRFCLYREIAENHEMSAKRQFNELKNKLSTNLMSYRPQLETVMYEFIDAYESYTKAGCHSHADSSAKLAKLISLQIHYLPNNISIINMKSNEISHFIEHNNNFFEALIIAEAYQYNTSWVSALFNHVILNNDSNYLSDYMTQRDISTSFVEELVHKYFQFISNKNLSNDRLLQMKKSMQKLIQYIDDYETQFRLAAKLNLTEVNHKMLSEESGAYLQDLRRNGLL